MKAKVGDTIVVESERVTQPARRGTIAEILEPEQPRFRVRWEDGRETILAPQAGSARIEAKRRKTRARA